MEKNKRKKIEEKEKNEIIKLYQEGKMPKEIAEQFGILSGSVTRIIRKNGVPRDKCVRLSEADKKTIIDRYISGESSEKIAKDFYIAGTTVTRTLEKNNICIRGAEENKRKYKIKDDFFRNIDAEDKAYFLGLLYADGCIRNGKGRRSIRLMLHPRDEDILIKFSNIIFGKSRIKTRLNKRTQREYKAVYIYSKRMVNDLCNLGCTQNKTFTITFPKDLINDELFSHFIRGYFDGDGCICLKNKYKTVVDITSNRQFVEGLRDYLGEKLSPNYKDTALRQIHPELGTATTSIQFCSRERVDTFLNYIYKDATIYFQRKYDLYQEYLLKQKNKKVKNLNKVLNRKYYGSTYVPEYNGNLLTTEYLETIDEEEKEIIAKEMISFYRKNGFPYLSLSDDELVKEFTSLKNKDSKIIMKEGDLSIDDHTGTNIVKYFSPHFFEVKTSEKNKPSILEAFNDDNLLEKAILNRLEYKYTLNGNMLRQGLVNSKIAYRTSSFNTLVAKYIYEKYVPENGLIYDYSMGFGHRLLAALSLKYPVKYIGVDPCQRSVESNKNIYNFYNKNVPMLNKKIHIECCGSEDFIDNNYINSVDVAFSSPPYYNLEVYEENESQAYNNRSYTEFINDWWNTVVKNIYILLKQNGKLILNMKEILYGYNLADDMTHIILNNGFELEDTIYIRLTKNLVFNNKKGVHKREPIFIFTKK